MKHCETDAYIALRESLVEVVLEGESHSQNDGGFGVIEFKSSVQEALQAINKGVGGR